MHFRFNRARLGLISGTVAAGLTLGAITAGPASAAQTLRIMYNPNPTNTSIIVAQQEGFFKKNGLNVKLESSPAAAALLPDVGKQFDLVTTTPTNVLQGAAAGLKVQLVGGETFENTGALRSTYFIADKGITSVTQLKGKKIGVPSLSGVLYDSAIIRLNRAGIKLNQVTFVQVPFPDMFSDLQSGTIQAAMTVYPFQGQMLGAGMVNLGNPVENVVKGKALDAGWVAYAPWVATHKKVLAEFDKAQREALAWMNANQAAAKQLLTTPALGSLPSFVANTYNVTGYVSFAVTPKYLMPWVHPLFNAGQLKKLLTPAEVKSLVYEG